MSFTECYYNILLFLFYFHVYRDATCLFSRLASCTNSIQSFVLYTFFSYIFTHTAFIVWLIIDFFSGPVLALDSGSFCLPKFSQSCSSVSRMSGVLWLLGHIWSAKTFAVTHVSLSSWFWPSVQSCNRAVPKVVCNLVIWAGGSVVYCNGPTTLRPITYSLIDLNSF